MALKKSIQKQADTDFFQSVTLLIEQSRQQVVASFNAELVSLYWNVGTLIKKNILQNKRAGYGEQIIATLSGELIKKYGDGWSTKQLNHCLRSAETFSKKQIVSAVRRQLSWTHLKSILYLSNPLQREFYLEMCIAERWSTRQLQERIDSMLYERTAISKKPEALIKKELTALRNADKPSPDLIFRDPYILDFLGLKDTYSEKDLESAILAELQRFIVELGSDFAFLARQKRIQIDSEDYYIDLLFYHRQLQRLVAVDLKLGKFKAAYKAQMELYLNWLNKHERKETEQTPIGLILCADKSDEHIELLELNKGNIRVAQYYTELPPKKLLEQKLHKAWLAASEKFADDKKIKKK
ncbi:MAG TPA: PDDEXK nuclease domain-containing protein [Chitinophagaceae bacterium]|jgi:predicted nuclease of restriction endonuclease-like (RecB) superfamily|nr:PDDEXK nuclease domain-containing protein [Chitinophagaceae bacterium]HMU59725.1 PDDEXK nuclease domain-containing protein [Chitinophagaceae bacterium]